MMDGGNSRPLEFPKGVNDYVAGGFAGSDVIAMNETLHILKIFPLFLDPIL